MNHSSVGSSVTELPTRIGLDKWRRRSVLHTGAIGLAALLTAGCAGSRTVPAQMPTPFAPRTGNRDVVRIGLFGTADGSPPLGPIGELAGQLSGTDTLGKLQVRMVPIPYTGWPNDLDTHQFVPDHPPGQKQLKGVSWQLLVALQNSVRSEDIPDLVVFDRLDQIRYAADHGLLLPLGGLLAAAGPPVKDAWPGAFEIARHRGQVWALPLAVQPLVLTYAPAIFQSGGVSLPDDTWDWQRLLAAAKALTKTRHLEWQAPEQKGGQFGFFVGTPDTLALFVWQAGGDILAGTGTQVHCALTANSAIHGEEFYFDLIHRDEVSPAWAINGSLQTPSGLSYGTAAMQFGPATVPNIALPPRDKVVASGYALDASGPCLALSARASDTERAYQVAAVLAARLQGRYDWPVSQNAAAARAGSSAQATVAMRALAVVHPPGRYGDVRDAVEGHLAQSLVTTVASPDVAVLNGRSIVEYAAQSGCKVVDTALREAG